MVVGNLVPSVVAKPTALSQAPASTGLVLKCVLVEGKPGHVVVDNHACMRQVFTAIFLSIPDEKNSHPVVKVEINSLAALPYVVNEKYVMELRVVK